MDIVLLHRNRIVGVLAMLARAIAAQENVCVTDSVVRQAIIRVEDDIEKLFECATECAMKEFVKGSAKQRVKLRHGMPLSLS
jgi:hypothetical protein